MKNNLTLIMALGVVLFVVVGCSSLTSRVEKSITGEQKTSSGSNGGPSVSSDDDPDESTGVPECDQAIKTIDDEVTRESSNSNESWAVRGTRRFMFTQMKRGLKSIIDEHRENSNSNDKLNNQNIAQTCKDFQKKIDEEIKKDIANGK